MNPFKDSSNQEEKSITIEKFFYYADHHFNMGFSFRLSKNAIHYCNIDLSEITHTGKGHLIIVSKDQIIPLVEKLLYEKCSLKVYQTL